MTIRFLRLAALCLAAFFCLPAHAWDPVGHMIIGQIAYDNLTPTARAKVDEAIERMNRGEKEKYDFVISACWMDDIRSRTKTFNPWHYVNLPFTLEGLPIPDGEETPNVTWGIELSEAILSGSKTHRNVTKDQAVAVLAHLVGDVHQPLHTTSRNDDLGGNRVEIANLRSPAVDTLFGGGGNLHFFWDSAYRRVFKDGKADVAYEPPLYDRNKPVAGHREALPLVAEQVKEIVATYPPSALTDQGNAASWTGESHRIGYEMAYGKLPEPGPDGEIILTPEYVDEAREIARKRLAMAGYRLANDLNQLLDPAKKPE